MLTANYIKELNVDCDIKIKIFFYINLYKQYLLKMSYE